MSTGDEHSSEDDLEIIEEPEAVEDVQAPNEEFENQNEDQPEDKKETKVKRVRNPQPKLDAERLRGPRGLSALEGIFSKVKFKGSKHEEEDLNLLMRTYEYWCHRLFPKYPLDDCLGRLEKLGMTKAVNNHLKMLRMDLTDDKPISDSDEEVPADDSEAIIDINPIIRDDFDRLLPTRIPQPQVSTSTISGELSEEQLERIRLNREKAQQRRKEMQIRNSQLSQEPQVCTQPNQSFDLPTTSTFSQQINYPFFDSLPNQDDIDSRSSNNHLTTSQDPEAPSTSLNEKLHSQTDIIIHESQNDLFSTQRSTTLIDTETETHQTCFQGSNKITEDKIVCEMESPMDFHIT